MAELMCKMCFCLQHPIISDILIRLSITNAQCTMNFMIGRIATRALMEAGSHFEKQLLENALSEYDAVLCDVVSLQRETMSTTLKAVFFFMMTSYSHGAFAPRGL